jgi:hypothetical protein
MYENCIVVDYDQEVKRELKRIYVNGCRYNERLNPKKEESKDLVYTELKECGLRRSISVVIHT